MANEYSSDGPRTIPVSVPPPDQWGSRPPARPTAGEFTRRTVVAVLITVLLVSLALMAWRGVHVLLESFAGVLFAIFLSSLADWLCRRTGIRYGWSLAIVVAALFLLAGGTGWLLANRLSAQVSQLTETLPKSFREIRDYLSQYKWGQHLLEHVPNSAASMAQINSFSQVTGLIAGVSAFLVTVVVILFVGIFGAAEPTLYREGLMHLIPSAHRPRARQALNALAFNLRWWLLGQVFLMVVIGVTTTVCLWAIGIPLALTLGLIAGICEMVPYIGPWLSFIPTALMALLLGPHYLLAVAGLYLGLHILEGYVLLPLVQRRSVHLPPALTLVGQVLLGDLLGLMGLFVAAPLTVCAVVLLQMLYVEDTLGDEGITVPGEPDRVGSTQ